MLIFPLLVTFIFVFLIKKTDSNLKPAREIVIPEKLNKRIIIDKHASKRRVYFFVEKHNQKIKFERKYSGFVTNLKKKLEYRKYEKNEVQNFFIEKNNEFDTKESIPFFGLNQSEKKMTYYFDIFESALQIRIHQFFLYRYVYNPLNYPFKLLKLFYIV